MQEKQVLECINFRGAVKPDLQPQNYFDVIILGIVLGREIDYVTILNFPNIRYMFIDFFNFLDRNLVPFFSIILH